MRGLKLLAELARRETDERCATLNQIGTAKANADAAYARHEQKFSDESRIALDDPAMLVTRDAWSRHDERVGKALCARTADLARHEANAREALRTAFADMKRIESARDTSIMNEQTLAARRTELMATEAFAAARQFAAS